MCVGNSKFYISFENCIWTFALKLSCIQKKLDDNSHKMSYNKEGHSLPHWILKYYSLSRLCVPKYIQVNHSLYHIPAPFTWPFPPLPLKTHLSLLQPRPLTWPHPTPPPYNSFPFIATLLYISESFLVFLRQQWNWVCVWNTNMILCCYFFKLTYSLYNRFNAIDPPSLLFKPF